MKKHTISSEISYIAGLIFTALGVALMARADLGVSMLVAPAHAIHIKIEEFTHAITLGMVEFGFQVVLLLIMILALKKFKISYLWAFITTLIYGVILDVIMIGTNLIPDEHIAIRILMFVLGGVCTSSGVALMFRTYIAPEIYELLVIEISEKFHLHVHKFKTYFDCACCVLAIILEFSFFGLFTFKAVGVGTIIFALVNGTMISAIGKFLDNHFDFERKIKIHKKNIDKSKPL